MNKDLPTANVFLKEVMRLTFDTTKIVYKPTVPTGYQKALAEQQKARGQGTSNPYIGDAA